MDRGDEKDYNKAFKEMDNHFRFFVQLLSDPMSFDIKKMLDNFLKIDIMVALEFTYLIYVFWLAKTLVAKHW